MSALKLSLFRNAGAHGAQKQPRIFEPVMISADDRCGKLFVKNRSFPAATANKCVIPRPTQLAAATLSPEAVNTGPGSRQHRWPQQHFTHRPNDGSRQCVVSRAAHYVILLTPTTQTPIMPRLRFFEPHCGRGKVQKPPRTATFTVSPTRSPRFLESASASCPTSSQSRSGIPIERPQVPSLPS